MYVASTSSARIGTRRAIQAAQLDLRDVHDARHLGDPLEELAELMIARLRVQRDRDLAVVVANDRRTRLEERDAEPRCRGSVGDRSVEGGNLLLARQPVLQRVEARFELRGLPAVLQEIGDDRPVPGDLALQRAQLRAELRDLGLDGRQREKVGGGQMTIAPRAPAMSFCDLGALTTGSKIGGSGMSALEAAGDFERVTSGDGRARSRRDTTRSTSLNFPEARRFDMKSATAVAENADPATLSCPPRSSNPVIQRSLGMTPANASSSRIGRP